MALETISLSDIGLSLVAIEAEVRSNMNSISYHKEQIASYESRNKAMNDLATLLLKMNAPKLTGN